MELLKGFLKKRLASLTMPLCNTEELTILAKMDLLVEDCVWRVQEETLDVLRNP